MQAEQKRQHLMSLHERRLRLQGYSAIAGVDEAGRGPLAGPVVAAACILPPDYFLPFLNDSKQLSAAKREELFSQIVDDPKVFFGLSIVTHQRIDEINILQATLEAMQQAVRNLSTQPDYLLIDGNQLPTFSIPAEGLIQGDALSITIAAASILAKVTRDRIMVKEALLWPQYGFERHKGYATEKHMQAIRQFGPCPLHRKSFEPVKSIDQQCAFIIN